MTSSPERRPGPDPGTSARRASSSRRRVRRGRQGQRDTGSSCPPGSAAEPDSWPGSSPEDTEPAARPRHRSQRAHVRRCREEQRAPTTQMGGQLPERVTSSNLRKAKGAGHGGQHQLRLDHRRELGHRDAVGKSGSECAAANASRVLPTPPGPVSVSSRTPSVRSRSTISSSSRHGRTAASTPPVRVADRRCPAEGLGMRRPGHLPPTELVDESPRLDRRRSGTGVRPTPARPARPRRGPVRRPVPAPCTGKACGARPVRVTRARCWSVPLAGPAPPG